MIRLLLKLRRCIRGSLELIVGLCARDTRMNERELCSDPVFLCVNNECRDLVIDFGSCTLSMVMSSKYNAKLLVRASKNGISNQRQMST